jgi:hypothetical protein
MFAVGKKIPQRRKSSDTLIPFTIENINKAVAGTCSIIQQTLRETPASPEISAFSAPRATDAAHLHKGRRPPPLINVISTRNFAHRAKNSSGLMKNCYESFSRLFGTKSRILIKMEIY